MVFIYFSWNYAAEYLLDLLPLGSYFFGGQVYLISHDRFLYKTQDGGETWKKVMLDAIVQEELIFHDDGIYKDHIMIITYERKVESFEVIAWWPFWKM